MRIKNRRIAAILLVLASVSIFLFSNRQDGGNNLFFVKRVIDGDTILLANSERVRYIGINTPETKHPDKPIERFGKEASSYNKKLVEKKWVRLEFDIQKRDKYNRLLAYVFTGETFINAELIKEGYGQVYTIPPNVKYSDLFIKLQREAKDRGRGLWAK